MDSKDEIFCFSGGRYLNMYKYKWERLLNRGCWKYGRRRKNELVEALKKWEGGDVLSRKNGIGCSQEEGHLDTYTVGTRERERDGQRVERLIAGRNGVS